MEAPEDIETRQEKKDKVLYIVLEHAFLETVKIKNRYQLLNCDDHVSVQKRAKRDPSLARPDILHQCLLSLLDSPLNKAGHLKILVHTQKNAIVAVHPGLRIPRTFRRFSGLMVQLLHKLSIRAANGPDKLLRLVKGPLENHLPTGARRIGLTVTSDKLVRVADFAATLPDQPVVFVIGAMSHGAIKPSYPLDDTIAVSEFPLSAALCCTKVCSAFEQKWGVL